jgi:hypothetical protein
LNGLTTRFGNARAPGDEEGDGDDPLLNLYWNRAELKKEFAALRSANFDLEDRLKRQEGATARVEQKLQHIENLLLDPEWVYNVVTHYQLRGLESRARRRLERFAEELKQKREKKQHGQRLAEWNEQRELEATAIEHEIGACRLAAQEVEQQIEDERSRLAGMNGFIRLLRRREVDSRLHTLEGRLAATRTEEHDLLRQHEAVQNRVPPDTEGLDIATKRMINFMILAFAQHLYIQLRDDGLAALAKDAADKSVGAVNFGDKQACDEIIAGIGLAAVRLDSPSGYAESLRRRARLIARKALFATADDAVPRPATVSAIIDVDGAQAAELETVNLLGENYWGVAGVVSR